jgi:hypothetical protein
VYLTPHPRGLWLAAAFAAAAVCSLVAPVAPEARVVKRLDYDTGNFNQWTTTHARPHGTRIVRRPRKQGRYAARFLVRPGDSPVGSGERSEVLYFTNEHAGTTSWWKWSTRFPRGFRPINGSMNLFTQWHHTGPTCPVPVAFRIDAWERPYVELKVAGGSFNPVTCDTGSGRLFNLGRIRRGHWNTFVFHVRWSPDPDRGFVKVWRDGRVVVPFTRMATIYSGYSVYVKQGYYRAPAGWSATVYHDGLRRFNARPRSLR